MWYFTGINTDVSFDHVAVGRLIQAVAIPALFVPINAQAYAGLSPSRFNHASALMNVARNLGGSVGISTAQALLLQREQFHQNRIVESLNPLDPNYVEGLKQLGMTLSGGTGDADQSQLAALYQMATKQAAMISYIDVFHVLAVVMILMVPLSILLKPARGEH